MASSREDWQAIGKRRQAVGKRLEGRSNSSQTIVKQWSNGRRDQGAGAENCGVGNAAENSRTENHVRWRICSLRIAVNCGQRPRRFKIKVVPTSAPSPSPRYGGVEPGSKSGPPPSSPIGSFGDDDIKKTFIHRRVGLPANSPRCEAGKFSSGRRTQILRSMILAANSPNLPLPPTTASLLFHATCLVAVSQLLHAG